MKRLLKYRTSLKEALPLISLIIALNLILLGVGTYITVTRVFLNLFIYLTSTLLATFIKKRYYLYYVLIIIPLCLLITIFDFSYFFISFLPSLLISFLFSLSIDKRFDKYLTILLSSIALFIFTLIGIEVTNFIYNDDILNLLLRIFNLHNNEDFLYYLNFFIYSYSFIIIFLTYLFIKYEIKRFNLEFNSYEYSKETLGILVIILFIPSIILLTLNIDNYLLILILLIFIIGVNIVNEDLKRNDRLNYIVTFGIGIFISITLFFVIGAYVPTFNSFFFFIIPTILVVLSDFIELIIRRMNKKRIN